jgi:hypothetical protein
MSHYRIYQLDPSDHITAGYSVECGADTEALRAAARLLQLSPAAAVEVWQGKGRISRLLAGGPWVRLRRRWMARVARPSTLGRRLTGASHERFNLGVGLRHERHEAAAKG